MPIVSYVKNGLKTSLTWMRRPNYGENFHTSANRLSPSGSSHLALRLSTSNIYCIFHLIQEPLACAIYNLGTHGDTTPFNDEQSWSRSRKMASVAWVGGAI